MTHLFESSELYGLSKLDDFVRRFRSSGYVSSKMETILSEVSSVPDFVNVLYERCEVMSAFFLKCNTDLIDDILLEYFEDYYRYTVSPGFCFAKSSYYSDSSSYTPMESSILGKMDSVSGENLTDYLFVSFLEKMWKSTRESIIKSQEEISKKRVKGKFFFPSKPVNYFKMVGKIQPIYFIYLEHIRKSDLEDWWDNAGLALSSSVIGYGLSDLSSNYSSSENMAKRIISRLNRFRLSFGAECSSIGLGQHFFTPSNYWDGEGYVRNENPVLRSGILEIRFKI